MKRLDFLVVYKAESRTLLLGGRLYQSIKMKFKFVRCLPYKIKSDKCWSERWYLSSAVLEKTWKILAVTLPPLFDFATHRFATFLMKWAVALAALSASAVLTFVLLEAMFHIFLATTFDVHPEGAMIQLPIIWEEWWPRDTDIVNSQTQLMSSVTEVSSQSGNFWALLLCS